LGINQQGIKEVLGIWVAESEGAKFWLQILSELKSRGMESVLIACVDGLKGFPEAIKTVFPEATVQVCIVHQIRHTVKFVSHKDRKELCEDLKNVYAAPSEVVGLQALEEVKQKWPQYSFCINKWEQRWTDLSPFFAYPEQIRRIMYTTNTIENLNRQFRKVTKTTGVFPHDESLLKLLWLAQDEISRAWTLPIGNWGQIISQFAILFPDKINTQN
jgi:transposase-like protein